MSQYLYAYDFDGDASGNHALRVYPIASDGSIGTALTQVVRFPSVQPTIGDTYTGPIIRQNIAAVADTLIFLPGQIVPNHSSTVYRYQPIFTAAILGTGLLDTPVFKGKQTSTSCVRGAYTLKDTEDGIYLYLGTAPYRASSGAEGWLDRDSPDAGIVVHPGLLTDPNLSGMHIPWNDAYTGPAQLWAIGNYLHTHSSKDPSGYLGRTWHSRNARLYRLDASNPNHLTSTTPESGIIPAQTTPDDMYGQRLWFSSGGKTTYLLNPSEGQSGSTLFYDVYVYTLNIAAPTVLSRKIVLNAGSNAIQDIIYTFSVNGILSVVARLTNATYKIYQGAFSESGDAVVLNATSDTSHTWAAPPVRSFNTFTTGGGMAFTTNIPVPTPPDLEESPVVAVTGYDATADNGTLSLTGTASHSEGVTAIQIKFYDATAHAYWTLDSADLGVTFTPTTALSENPTDVDFTMAVDLSHVFPGITNGTTTFTLWAYHNVVTGTDTFSTYGLTEAKTFRWSNTPPAIYRLTVQGEGVIPGTQAKFSLGVSADNSSLVRVAYANLTTGDTPDTGDWTDLYTATASYGLPSVSLSPGVGNFTSIFSPPAQTVNSGTLTLTLHILALDAYGHIVTKTLDYSLNTDAPPVTIAITDTTTRCAFSGPRPPSEWEGQITGLTTGASGSPRHLTLGIRPPVTIPNTLGPLSTLDLGVFSGDTDPWFVSEAQLIAAMGAADPSFSTNLKQGLYHYSLTMTDTYGGVAHSPSTGVTDMIVDHAAPTVSGGLADGGLGAVTFPAQKPTFTMTVEDTLSGVSTDNALSLEMEISGEWVNKDDYILDASITVPTGGGTTGTRAVYTIQITDFLNVYRKADLGNTPNRFRTTVTDRCGNFRSFTTSVYVINKNAPLVTDILQYQSFEPGNP